MHLYYCPSNKGEDNRKTYAVKINVIGNEVLKSLEVSDDAQSKMSNAEVTTFAIQAEKYSFLSKYFEQELSKS